MTSQHSEIDYEKLPRDFEVEYFFLLLLPYSIKHIFITTQLLPNKLCEVYETVKHNNVIDYIYLYLKLF